MKALFPVSIKQAEEQKNRKQKEQGIRDAGKLGKEQKRGGNVCFIFPVSCSMCFNLYPVRIRYRGADLFLYRSKRETEARKKAIQTRKRYRGILFRYRRNRAAAAFIYSLIHIYPFIYIYSYLFIHIQEMIFLLSFCDLSLALFFQRVYIMYVK